MNMDIHSTDEYSPYPSIEVAILQQDIELPEVSNEPLTLATLEAYEEAGEVYKLADQEFKNAIGNFYVPILFPLVENGESTELEFDAPEAHNVLNESIQPVNYVERNFIQLVIPKHLVMNFRDVIPSGTKFIIGFIGGNKSIENIVVLGVHGEDLL